MMTMMREPVHLSVPGQNPSVRIHIPSQWDPQEDTLSRSPVYGNAGSGLIESLAALHRYLPSNDTTAEEEQILGAFSCDHFRMYEFKVRRCARGRSHDWTECPYAHPGEKARRRDPRRYHYSGTACPEFRKGSGCRKGDSCELAHGVFECWLHPARYRTQPCKDGSACRRRVCFFAHTHEQLRVLSQGGISFASSENEYGSPHRVHHTGSFLSSPTSILVSPPVSPPSDSPPMSPSSPGELSDLVSALRGMQLGKMRIGVGHRGSQPPTSMLGSPHRSCHPSTPTRTQPASCGLLHSEIWDVALFEAGPPMERVESGRDIRAKMYAKLSKENSLGRGIHDTLNVAPDIAWVSELLK